MAKLDTVISNGEIVTAAGSAGIGLAINLRDQQAGIGYIRVPYEIGLLRVSGAQQVWTSGYD